MPVPVSLNDAKRHLRIELNDASQDEEVQGWIADAAAWVERYTGHILVARLVTETFDCFSALRLRSWPIAAGVVPGVSYPDALTGNPVAVATVRMEPGSGRPARVVPSAGSRWPSVRPASISVTLRAGYEPDATPPGNFRRAMLVLIAAYDGDREGGDMFVKAEATAKSLCRSYRLVSV